MYVWYLTYGFTLVVELTGALTWAFCLLLISQKKKCFLREMAFYFTLLFRELGIGGWKKVAVTLGYLSFQEVYSASLQ